MATKLQLRRGLTSELTQLAEGEPGFTTDGKKLYIGHSDGNIEMETSAGAQEKVDIHKNITSGAHQSTAIAFTQTGTGAVTRTIDDKIKDTFKSVKDFGAVGDGVTNDTTAIKNAFANHKEIYFPPGTYIFNGRPTLSGNTVIKGDNSTILITGIEGTNYYYKVFDLATYSLTISDVNMQINLPANTFPSSTDETKRMMVFHGTQNLTIKNSNITINANNNQVILFYLFNNNLVLQNVTGYLDTTGLNAGIMFLSPVSAGQNITASLIKCDFTQTCHDEIIGCYGLGNIKFVATDCTFDKTGDTQCTVYMTAYANVDNINIDMQFNSCVINSSLTNLSYLIRNGSGTRLTGSARSKVTFNSCKFKVDTCTYLIFGNDNVQSYGYADLADYSSHVYVDFNDCEIFLSAGNLVNQALPMNANFKKCKLHVPKNLYQNTSNVSVITPVKVEFDSCKIYPITSAEYTSGYFRAVSIVPEHGSKVLFKNCEIDKLDTSVDYKTVFKATDGTSFTLAFTSSGGAYCDGCHDENLVKSNNATFLSSIEYGTTKPDKVTSLPTAGATQRGRIVRIEGVAGTADLTYVCEKKSDDTYYWRRTADAADVGTLSSLTTTAKTSTVAAINELDADIGDKSTLTTTAKTNLVAAINELDGDVGDKSTLTTTAKTTLVAAVNELDGEVGTLSSLTTTAQDTLVAAINEVDGDVATLFTRYTTVPTTATSIGTAGQWAADATYLYICHATNTWKRVAVATW